MLVRNLSAVVEDLNVLADLAPRFLSGFVAALMHESVREVRDVGITSLSPSLGEDRGSSPVERHYFDGLHATR